jgi:hypothetical protein
MNDDPKKLLTGSLYRDYALLVDPVLIDSVTLSYDAATKKKPGKLKGTNPPPDSNDPSCKKPAKGTNPLCQKPGTDGPCQGKKKKASQGADVSSWQLPPAF